MLRRRVSSLRVHHIINSYDPAAGGAELLVRRLHLGLRARGIESLLLGLQAYPDNQLKYSRSLGLDSPYGLKALGLLRHYVKMHVQEGDMVHAHLFPTMLYLSILKIFGRIKGPLLCTEHSTSNSRRGTWYGRIIDSVTYRGYDRVVAISEGAANTLAEWQPRLADSVSVVYNGARSNFSTPIKRKLRSCPVVLSVGRLCAHKNYSVALDAIALLKDVPFEYWIAGDGEDSELLKSRCRTLGLENKVRFLGHVFDVAGLLEKADVFFMPSVNEGFGLAAVEAMNASLPIVASDIPGLREVVDNDPSAAILVNPGSPQSMASALGELLLSHDQRLMLGLNGFNRAAYFDEDRMIDGYCSIYTRLAGQ